jgi:hypothetical protein
LRGVRERFENPREAAAFQGCCVLGFAGRAGVEAAGSGTGSGAAAAASARAAEA